MVTYAEMLTFDNFVIDSNIFKKLASVVLVEKKICKWQMTHIGINMLKQAWRNLNLMLHVHIIKAQDILKENNG